MNNDSNTQIVSLTITDHETGEVTETPVYDLVATEVLCPYDCGEPGCEYCDAEILTEVE